MHLNTWLLIHDIAPPQAADMHRVYALLQGNWLQQPQTAGGCKLSHTCTIAAEAVP